MRVCVTLIAAASIVAIASSAAAHPDRVATQVRVSEAGVDFSDPASTATFYASLERAAAKACDSGMGRNLTVAAMDSRCATEALDRAVRDAGVTALAALHEAKTGRAATTALAAR